MVSSEVSHQLHEQLDVSHVVQQVLVSQLLWRGLTNGLQVLASALTVSCDNCVLDHLALLALEILELIGDKSLVNHIKKSGLNVLLVQWSFTVSAVPVVSLMIFWVKHLVQLIVSADVKI